MPDTFTVKVHGLEELERELNALPEKYAKPALRTGARKSAQAIQRAAQGLVKVRTGKLRENIAVATRVESDGVRGSTIIATIGLKKRGFYGRFLELGTKYIGKVPFLGAAFQSLIQTILQIFITEVRKSISRIRVKNKLL